jgi:hypothetical protein
MEKTDIITQELNILIIEQRLNYIAINVKSGFLQDQQITQQKYVDVQIAKDSNQKGWLYQY